jgi:hypothetical protein
MQALRVGVVVLDGILGWTTCVGVARGEFGLDVPCFIDVIAAVSITKDRVDPWVSRRKGVMLGAGKVAEPQAVNSTNTR